MRNITEELALESSELQGKIDKLNSFLYSEGFFALGYEQQNMLQSQIYAMREYHTILKRRIADIQGWSKPPVTLNEPVTGRGHC